MAKKYYYLSVRYDDEPYGFGYRYISQDETIKVGDHVLVKRKEEEITGTVIEAEYYDYDNVPYPLEYTKEIIKKVDKDYRVEGTGLSCKPGSFVDCLHDAVTNNLKFNVYEFKYPSKNDMKYIDGFEDNVYEGEVNKKVLKFILNKIKEHNETNTNKIVKDIEDYFNTNKVYIREYYDDILKFLVENKIPAPMLYHLGVSLVLYPLNIEVVKLGITLLSLLGYPKDDGIYELFDDLSHVECLGYYLAMLFANQENSDELLIRASSFVNGWGKINYIERMNFEDENTLKWVLNGGYKNKLGMFEISPVIVVRTNLIEDLKKYIDDKRIVNNILDIVIGLNNGPNSLDYWKNNIDFLQVLFEYKDKLLDCSNYYLLLNEYALYLSNKENESSADIFLVDKIDDIKNDDSIPKHLSNIVKNGTFDDVDSICRFLMYYKGKEPRKEIFEFYKKQDNYFNIIYSYLMFFEDTREDTYNIVLKIINKDNYPKNIKPNYVWLPKFSNLSFIVNDLGNIPFYDNNIIAMAITCEDIKARLSALETLDKWMENTNTLYDNLEDILKDALVYAKDREMIKDNKELINKIMGIKENLKNYKNPKINNIYPE